MLDDAGRYLQRAATQAHLHRLQVHRPDGLRAEKAFNLCGDFGVEGRGEWSFLAPLPKV